MNRTDTAKCYAIACATYSRDADPAAIEGWHMVLSELPDGHAAIAATLKLCRRDNPHPPSAGEVYSEVQRMNGDLPPTTTAALGFYLAGEWTVHPLVEHAARKVEWDRHNAPDQAKWQFRNFYEAALYRHEAGLPQREALTDGPQRLAIGMAIDPEPTDRPSPAVNLAAVRATRAMAKEGEAS